MVVNKTSPFVELSEHAQKNSGRLYTEATSWVNDI